MGATSEKRKKEEALILSQGERIRDGEKEENLGAEADDDQILTCTTCSDR